MLSNKERGKLFQDQCRDALKRALNRDFNLEVPIDVGGKLHKFDLATSEKDIIVECKAIKFTESGNNPSAKITTLGEAVMYLSAVQGDPVRLLIVKQDLHPTRGETLASYFVRLNRHRLEHVTVLEMPENGGNLTCIHGKMQGTSRVGTLRVKRNHTGAATQVGLAS